MGLPCTHLLKIILRKNLSIVDYIYDYWKVKKDYELWREFYYYSQGLEKPKRGRPKRTKRNNLHKSIF